MNRIHLALIVDGRLWGPAYAAMRSVCLSTRRHDDLSFHLFHRGLDTDILAVFERITAEFGAELALHDVGGDSVLAWLLDKAPARNGTPDLGYARLLFAETLPRELERVVALDGDVLVRAPIERLAGMDLLGRTLAAAPDPGRELVDPRGLFETGSRHFDPGLMVIDLARWRDLRLVDRFEALLDSGGLRQLRSAGECLNLMVGDDWFELGQLWNLVDPKALHEPLNPFAVHYSGPDKPWHLTSRAGFRRLYRRTMTSDVYSRFLAERAPAWLRPLVMRTVSPTRKWWR